MFNFFKEYGWYVAAGVVLGVGIIVAGPAVAAVVVSVGKAIGTGVKKIPEIAKASEPYIPIIVETFVREKNVKPRKEYYPETMKVPGGYVDRECYEELIGSGDIEEWQDAVYTCLVPSPKQKK